MTGPDTSSPTVDPHAAADPGAPPPGTRRPIAAIEVLAFVCEIFAIVVLGVWGFAAWPLPWNIVAGVLTPLGALLLWALFVSPRSVFAVHPFVRAIVELLVYAAATAALWMMGLTWVGVVYAAIAVTAGALAGRRRLA